MNSSSGASSDRKEPPPSDQQVSAPLEGGNLLYLVTGSTGEYSDRSEWPVCLFRTEAEAREYVDFLSRKRQELPSYHGLSWSEQQAVVNAMRVFDPEFSEDYTGTSWFAGPVPLCERGQGPASAQGAEGGTPEAPGGPHE